MNTPITNRSEDVVGFSTHVEKLDAAIASGGQMIALTSPFGAGKSSIVELLQEKYKNESSKQIIKISMWTHLSSDEKDDNTRNESVESTNNITHKIVRGETTELHKSFVYQLISQIDYQKGRYMSRLLNPSFGLLKLQTDKIRYWVCVAVAFALLLLGYVFPEVLKISFSLGGKNLDSLEWLMVFASALLFVIAITRGEIVFSSNKSEGGRKIDANEIMQLYRSEVLKYRLSSCKKSVHYIVVIEDLDRTNDSKAVINFLKEVRKYYIPDCAPNQKELYKNKVTFLINVKPETLLCSEDYKGREHEHLYAKLFDYILNLQTIHIDDYETVLEGLLVQKADELHRLGFKWNRPVADIPGMQWIIRGSRVGIREIKDRLNTAFSLFESLKQKFGERIEFEKCAIVAYLTTEFEEAFYKTDDHAFQELVKAYLKKELNDAKIDEILPNTDSNYKKEVLNLVVAKQIDNNYRIYFYNYPKGGRVLSIDEAIVQHAILYGEASEALGSSVEKVLKSESSIIKSAFQSRKQLGLLLPNIVFKNESLYIQSLKYAFPEVIAWIKALDYSTDSSEKTLEQFRTLLLFDADRIFYSKEMAQSFVEVWEEKFAETSLLQLRRLICKEFSSEATWYQALFGGVHKLVTVEELSFLSIQDAISLTNERHDSFSADIVQYFAERFLKEQNTDISAEPMQKFLEIAKETLGAQAILFPLLTYQQKAGRIVPDFEKSIIDSLLEEADTGIDKIKLLQGYQQLVNLTAGNGLSKQTIENISSLEKYDGYSLKVTSQMEEAGYILDYVLQALSCGANIPFERDNIVVALQTNINWLLKKPQQFMSVRKAVVKKEINVVRKYLFMFDENCPIMTQDELKYLYSAPVQDIIAMAPPSLITDASIDAFVPYFCQKKQGNSESMNILIYISQTVPAISEKMFYALDFDMVRYRYMSEERRNRVKDSFSQILSLGTSEGKIRFMSATRLLDPIWELQMLDELKGDEELQKKYVAAVKNEDSGKPITMTTVQVLCSFPTAPLVPERVYQRYFDFKYYKNYVSCKTRAQNVFEMEDGDRGALLWPVYVEIFGQGGYNATKKYMGKNTAFLERIMQEGSYRQMKLENLLPLASIRQSKECIQYILSLDVKYALGYLSKIAGFADKLAATAYVEGLEKNTDLLQSDELYEHTHKILPDKMLKAKYTRARTKVGFGKVG